MGSPTERTKSTPNTDAAGPTPEVPTNIESLGAGKKTKTTLNTELIYQTKTDVSNFGRSSPTFTTDKHDFTVTPDGADTTKTITRRIIGTPPGSPNLRSKANQFIIGTPPDSPTARTILSHSPNLSESKNISFAAVTDSASDTKGKSNSKLNPTTPPDSPNSMKSKSTGKLNVGTPPDSPSSMKSKSTGKLNLRSPSPYSSDGEFSDTEDSRKKKGSKLNLFGKLTGNSSSDDEKHGIWQRATKHVNGSKQFEGE